MATLNFARLLMPRDLSAILGVSVVTLWRMRRDGILPEPVQISQRRIGWPEEQIATWLESRTDSKKSA